MVVATSDTGGCTAVSGTDTGAVSDGSVTGAGTSDVGTDVGAEAGDGVVTKAAVVVLAVGVGLGESDPPRNKKAAAISKNTPTRTMITRGESFQLEKVSLRPESRPEPFSFGSFIGFCFLAGFILPFCAGGASRRSGAKTGADALFV